MRPTEVTEPRQVEPMAPCPPAAKTRLTHCSLQLTAGLGRVFYSRPLGNEAGLSLTVVL